MTGYTKGPWIEGIDGNNSVYGPDGMGRDSGLLATVYKGRGNIRLIAAAPDMYEALKEMERTYNELRESTPASEAACFKAREVLLKAEGKT